MEKLMEHERFPETGYAEAFGKDIELIRRLSEQAQTLVRLGDYRFGPTFKNGDEIGRELTPLSTDNLRNHLYGSQYLKMDIEKLERESKNRSNRK